MYHFRNHKSFSGSLHDRNDAVRSLATLHRQQNFFRYRRFIIWIQMKQYTISLTCRGLAFIHASWVLRWKKGSWFCCVANLAKVISNFKTYSFLGAHTIKTFLEIFFLVFARKDRILQWYVCFSHIRDTTSRFVERRIKFYYKLTISYS